MFGFFCPIVFPRLGKQSLQTESFEYRERSGQRTGTWQMQCRLEGDSFSLHLQLQPARVRGPLKSRVPKTLSSLAFCSCFCCRRPRAAFCSCCWRCLSRLLFLLRTIKSAGHVPVLLNALLTVCYVKAGWWAPPVFRSKCYQGRGLYCMRVTVRNTG